MCSENISSSAMHFLWQIATMYLKVVFQGAFYGSHNFPCQFLLLSTTVLNDKPVNSLIEHTIIGLMGHLGKQTKS